MGRILVVDAEPAVRSALARRLVRAGHEVDQCLDGLSAVKLLRSNRVDLALLALDSPDLNSMGFIRQLKRESPQAKVVVMSPSLDLETTEEAVKCGADKVMPKPCDVNRLAHAIESLLTGDADEPHIVAHSPQMVAVLERLDRLAATDISVLLVGETGTGKELLARRLHTASRRRHGPYVGVDCAALPESLLENELFGHEANAFTDGPEASVGRIPAADGGTLFLDEVANLSLPAQAKLLRALSERQVQRLGAPRPVSVDARVVAATNAELARLVHRGEFREDLYYRLAEAVVHVPPPPRSPL